MNSGLSDSIARARGGSRRILLWLLTLVLWLLSIGLGVLALMALLRIVEFRGALLILESGLVAPRYARGTLTTMRYVAAIAGGLLLLVVAILGMDFHFKHSGRLRSLRVFAWTLGVELLILLADVRLIQGG